MIMKAKETESTKEYYTITIRCNAPNSADFHKHQTNKKMMYKIKLKSKHIK